MSGYLLNDIYDVLGQIKLRRAMFLGNEHTFQSLESFVNGYTMAAREEQLRKNDLPKFTYFSTWLLGHLKKHFGDGGGWHWQISNRNPDNDKKCFEEFFYYLDLFKKSEVSIRLMVLNKEAIEHYKIRNVGRVMVTEDGYGAVQETTIMYHPVIVKWISMENSKTVWLEFIDKDDQTTDHLWFLKTKQAEGALKDNFGILTNPWTEISDR